MSVSASIPPDGADVTDRSRSVGALLGSAPPSPAGPAAEDDLPGSSPPWVPLPRALQVVRLSRRQIEFVFRWHREFGDVFRTRGFISGDPAVTGHPDHIRSLFTTKPALAPSLTGESPLLPIVGPNSVLTAQGERHLR